MMKTKKDYADAEKLWRRFGREKKALVPVRDYVDGHPYEEKIRRVSFKAGLKHPGHVTTDKFNEDLQKSIRTIVSKTYTDLFQTVRYTSNHMFTDDEREEHLDWVFAELEKYQQDAKALILRHLNDLEQLS